MTQPPNVDALVDQAAFFSFEHQLHLMDLAEQLGEHNFQVNLAASTLAFTGARGSLRTAAYLLGSTSESAGSWLWGWANPSFGPEVSAFSRYVAEVGGRDGIPELATPEVPLTPDIAARLTDAAKLITGRWTSYSCEAGPGTRAYMLIEAPELALPAPTVLRFMRVVGEGLGMGLVRDHRAALYSYTRLRGLSVAASPDGNEWRIQLPDGQVAVTFDGYGRIGNLSSSVGSPVA